MNFHQSLSSRPVLVVVCFFTALVAGWLSSPRADLLADAAGKLSADNHADPAAGTPAHPRSRPESPVSLRLERALTVALDPGSQRWSGERLAELCKTDYDGHIPGPNLAFQYAGLWARADPAGMFAWFIANGKPGLELPAQGGNYGFYNSIFAQWAKRDVASAMKAARGLNPFKARSAVAQIIQALRTTDPAQAAALAAENADWLVDGDRWTSSFDGFREDYRSTWDFLHALPAGESRRRLTAKFFDEMSEYHKEESVALWNGLPDADRRELVAGGFWGMRLIFAERMNAGSGLTLEGKEELWREHVLVSENPDDLQMYLRNGASVWAQKEPAAAIAWAQENLKGEQRVTSTAKLFRNGAAEQFDATVETWQALPEGTLKARAAGELAAGAPVGRKADAEALIVTLSPADQALARRIAGE